LLDSNNFLPFFFLKKCKFVLSLKTTVDGSSRLLGFRALRRLPKIYKIQISSAEKTSITVVCLALISKRGHVGVEICVNMLMEFLSAGSTQLNTRLGFARMVQAAIGGSVFLHTLLRSSIPCMYDVSTGSVVPSPRTSASHDVMDMASAMSLFSWISFINLCHAAFSICSTTTTSYYEEMKGEEDYGWSYFEECEKERK
jgi:hypothetical protein